MIHKRIDMKDTLISIIIFVGFFYTVVPITAQNSKTTIDFKIKNFGVYVHGSFSEATVLSSFDKNNIAESFVKATVLVGSLSTNNKKRDKHLLAPDYFDEPKYKQLQLITTKIEKTSLHQYKFTGTLTIKETTKAVVIPVTITENERSIKMKAMFEIDRKDYKVGGSSWVLSNTVKIEVNHTINK